MSTFNEFIINNDTQADLYTPLLYKEKGMKQGKEKFRQINRMMKQTSRKANEIGQGMQSQTELIKQAFTKFVGTQNVVGGINSIGQKINNKLDEINYKITGVKKFQKSKPVNQDSESKNNTEQQQQA